MIKFRFQTDRVDDKVMIRVFVENIRGEEELAGMIKMGLDEWDALGDILDEGSLTSPALVQMSGYLGH